MKELTRTNFAVTDRNMQLINVLQTRLLRQLGEYFVEPAGFLTALAKCSGVITGSWALSFILSPSNWTVKDLDIAIPRLSCSSEDPNASEPLVVSFCHHKRQSCCLILGRSSRAFSWMLVTSRQPASRYTTVLLLQKPQTSPHSGSFSSKIHSTTTASTSWRATHLLSSTFSTGSIRRL